MPRARSVFFRWLPAILWMGFIFIGSSDLLAGSHTSRFLVPFLKWLLGNGFTPEKAENVHFLIRKAGHLSEYAVLCSLFWFALGSESGLISKGQTSRFWLAVVLAGLYAASDEFHQFFIPTRTASIGDVMIDTTGAVIGLSLLMLILRLRAVRTADGGLG